MGIKKYIPNLFTLGNLLCGILAIVYAVIGKFEQVAIFVMTGIILDFFDGFLARILNVQGELGKQLDSLADMVTSGVAPGIVIFTMINQNSFVVEAMFSDLVTFSVINENSTDFYLSLVGFILTLAACYRLAKFNIDTRQSESFIGLPSSAMSLFVVSLPLIQANTTIELVRELVYNNYFLVGVTLVFSYLMNSNILLFSLKFKSFSFKENIYKYLLIIISLTLWVTLHYLAIPIVIMTYILLSLISNSTTKSNEV